MWSNWIDWPVCYEQLQYLIYIGKVFAYGYFFKLMDNNIRYYLVVLSKKLILPKLFT